MADGTSERELSAQDWMLDQIAGEEAALVVRAARDAGGDFGDDHTVHPADDHDGRDALAEPLASRDPALGQHRWHDLDPAADDGAGASGADLDAGAKRTAVWLGCAV
jgi:hypothetical protein